MKKLLAMLAVGSCSCLGLFGTSLGYANPGIVAPAFTFTAQSSGEEVGYFMGSTAGFTNLIGLWVNGKQLGSFALNNHTSQVGDSVDFGHVNAGDTLVFALQANDGSYVVSSDPSMNSDSISHVYTSSYTGGTENGVTIPAGTFVAFEDLLSPGSDLNYNDENVVFSNVAATAADPTATPEPASMLLLGTGLAGTALVAAKRKKQA
jgi:PEP-CTERM motif